MFVEQGYFAPSVVEESGQAGMIDLGAVCVVCEFEVEASRIEVLIDACGVEPMVVDGSWNIEIEVLHSEMIGPVVEDTLKIFLSQFAEGVDGVSDVTGGDGRLGRR